MQCLISWAQILLYTAARLCSATARLCDATGWLSLPTAPSLALAPVPGVCWRQGAWRVKGLLQLCIEWLLHLWCILRHLLLLLLHLWCILLG